MANPIKYSDFIKADDSIQTLIKQLEEANARYETLLKKVATEAASVEAALKKVAGTSTTNNETTKKAAAEAEKLTAAQKKLNESMSENATKLALLKVKQQEQNNINKLTSIVNKSQESSYNKLSAQYSLNKIRLNKMTAAQRASTKEGKLLEAQTKVIYTEMNRLQQATGKYTLQVGHYEIVAKQLTATLASLNARQKSIASTLGKNSQAYKLVSAEIDKTKVKLAGLTASQNANNNATARLITNVKSLIGMYAGLAAAQRIVTGVVDTMVDYESTMSNVHALSSANTSDMVKLSEQAQFLGATTIKTAIEVGKLQANYALLGYSTKEILEATDATIRLSIATREDVAQAAATAGSVIRAFGQDASRTGELVDVMAKSFTSSALNLDRYTESMKYVAKIANTANLSIPQTTAALSLLADAGIHGSMAGTSLRMIISRLDKDGKTFSENIKTLAERGMTLADAEDEVGRRAQTALLVLASNADMMDTLSDKYSNAAGSAKIMADIQSDNVAGSAKLLGSAISGLILKYSEHGTVMRTVLDTLTGMFSAMTRHIKLVKALTKIILLGAIAWGSYKIAIWGVTLAKKLHIATTFATIRAEGLMTFATRVTTSAMLSLNAAIKANPAGLLISLLITAASAYSLFSSGVKEATTDQEDFNEAVEDNKVANLIDELLTANAGDFGKTLKNIKSKLKVFSEDDISTFITGIKKQIRSLNREFSNQEPEYKLDPSFKKDYEDLKNFYKSIKKLAIDEQKKFNTVANTGLNTKQREQFYEAQKYEIIDGEEELRKLTDKELKKLLAVYVTADKLRVDAMAEGQDKDLEKLRISYESKKAQFIKYNLDISLLNNWYEQEKFKIAQSYADKAKALSDKKAAEDMKLAAQKVANEKKVYNEELKKLDLQKDLSLSEIELLKVTEAKKTRLRLKAEQDRLKAILDLNTKGMSNLSKVQIATIKNQIKALGVQMSNPKNKKYDLFTVAGLDLSDDKKEAISESMEFAVGQMGDFVDAKIKYAEAAVAASNTEVASAEASLNAEIVARSNGYASNVTLAQKELNLAKKNQAKALRLQEKANKQKIALDSVTQASSLVTASAKIWGQLGFPWAIPALAVMWGSFAFSKIKALQMTKTSTEKNGNGAFEIINGGSHQSGDDVDFGTTKEGKNRRVEGGEAFAIIKKSSTRKYRKDLPSIVNSLNKGTFEQKYSKVYPLGPQNIVVEHSSNVDLSNIENNINDIKQQGERKYVVDGNGRTIEIYKNLKRIYNAN